MDGNMTKREIQEEVMDYAVAVAGMMYHAYMARHCAWMAENAVREYAQRSKEDGVGSSMGEGLAQVTGAIPGNAVAEILAGNNKVARRAKAMGACLPTDEQVYDEAEKRGIVPKDWREKAFR